MRHTLHISDYIGEISNVNTGYDAFRLVKELSRSLGFDLFLIFDSSRDERTRYSERVVVTNWPRELLKRYDEFDLYEKSAVLRFLRASGSPLRLEIEQLEQMGANPEVLAINREFGLLDGICFPVHTADNNHGFIGFIGKNCQLSEEMQHQLHAFCLYFFERVIRVIDADDKPNWKISKRQMDCMRWIAVGKTSQEIAELLSISEHTVNHHISNVCTKLGAASRAHAVAKLLKSNLI